MAPTRKKITAKKTAAPREPNTRRSGRASRHLNNHLSQESASSIVVSDADDGIYSDLLDSDLSSDNDENNSSVDDEESIDTEQQRELLGLDNEYDNIAPSEENLSIGGMDPFDGNDLNLSENTAGPTAMLSLPIKPVINTRLPTITATLKKQSADSITIPDSILRLGLRKRVRKEGTKAIEKGKKSITAWQTFGETLYGTATTIIGTLKGAADHAWKHMVVQQKTMHDVAHLLCSMGKNE
eukprot:CCRYP_008795-RA/>CCRYP_008795-RA protein AED:0.32 eAED:0.32 QI:0/-1/0/1/-1/1/1/0/239